MPQWIVHYANACGQLDGWIERIGEGIAEARYRAEQVLPAIDLDVVVQVWPGCVVKEIGFVGYAPTGTMMQLTFDPDNENLSRNIGEPLERMIAHELHHVMRWRGPGYGTTLGDALVSEGLAEHFSRQLYGSAPEPWEVEICGKRLVTCAEKAKLRWNDPHYHHGAWFFGQGDLPRWAGYSLGYALVGRYLEDHADESASSLIHEPAASFLAYLDA
ncbi:DUF2268 domain-containing putative Zn-dependent protease [Halomonas binhaiensis]|uniref:DUF2268 domain-containing protein n=1 Tax=Halomonas binhaiensis TaxID=2562282 RepID=A0A5C1NKQ5_9GAMM|nr:DUF2268 domain-containing putative Zn-dependent protease [Halomonas binhaiensis]QEM82419.1 hypothetical protein E4T21_13355 [Halomonas binhaiensis]